MEYCAGPGHSSYSTLAGSFTVDDDNRRLQMLADTVATLPRGRKQLALTRSSSVGDFSWSQRLTGSQTRTPAPQICAP